MRTAALSDISDSIEYGVTASATSEPVGPKFLRITDIQNGTVDWSSVPFCAADERKLTSARLQSGDIVFARTGATTGKSFLIRECPENAVFASYLIRVRPGKEVDPAFLAHFFDSPNYWNQIALKAAGAAQPGVNASKLKQLEIPLPPLDEQKRIGVILDQADALRRLRQRTLDRLNTLAQSIFYEMFGRGLGEWPKKSLSSLGAVLTGSTPPTANELYFDGDVPFVTPGDLGSDEPVKRTVSEEGASKSRIVTPGATLVCCIGATIGKIDKVRERSAFNQQINAVQWGVEIDPEYGTYALKAQRQIIIHKGKGASTTLPILKKSTFQKLSISVPPKDLQATFSSRLAEIYAQSAELKVSEKYLGKLFASLQKRAFRGEF